MGSIAGVGGGAEAVKLFLDGVGYLEGVDEGGDAFGGHGGVDAGELLEGLVGVGVALAAQDCLDAFGNYAPHAVEVGVDSRTVEDELAETLEGGGEGNHHVAHGHADVAEHRGVGEVALQAAHGRFSGRET